MGYKIATPDDLVRAQSVPQRPNWERQLFDPAEGGLSDATLSDEQVRLYEDIKKLEGEMFNRVHDTRYTRDQNDEYRARRLFEIESIFYNDNKRMSEQLAAEDAKIKKKYLAESEADPTRLLLEQRRWENRYSAMTKEQLEEEAADYLHNDNPAWSPDRLDALAAFLNKAKVRKLAFSETAKLNTGGSVSGPVSEKTFSEWVEARHGREPWRKGRESFYTAKKMYESELGQAVVLNSFGQLETVNIDKIYMEKTGMGNEE